MSALIAPAARRQQGFSLVELMVAMTLSLVLLAGALSVLYSTKVTNTENDRLARLQENGRAAVELMLRDARSSGYQGCMRPGFGTVVFENRLPSPTATLWNFAQPVYGFNANGGSWLPAMDSAAVPGPAAGAEAPLPGSDVLVLRTTRQGTPKFRLTAGMANFNSPMSVEGPAGATVAIGDTMVVTDCATAVAFTVTNFAAGTPSTISHGPLGFTFGLNSEIVYIDTVSYYVANSTTGNGPALYQRIGDRDPEILVEGVENMQVLYGIGNSNMVATSYVNAGAVTNWDNVVSITVSLLLRSETEENLDRDTRTYTMLDTVFDPNPDDRRQRALFTTTATLRNRTR